MVAGGVISAIGIVGLMSARSGESIALWLMMVGAGSATGGVNLYAVAQIFAGPRASGTFIGIQNATGNLSGIIMPVVTGAIIDATGVYDNGFLLTAAIAVIGGLWWLIGVPRIAEMTLD